MARYYKRRRLGGNPFAPIRGVPYAMPYSRKRKRPPGGSTVTGAPLRLGRRVRPRMAASYSFTKTQQRKKRPGRITTHGDNMSSSVNSIGKKFLSRFDKYIAKKIVSPQTVFYNGTAQLASTTGVQAISSLSFMTSSDLNDLFLQAQGGVASSAPTKVFFKSGKSIYRLRNQSNCVAKLTVYDIVVRRNPPSSSLDTPIECWSKGLADYNVASGIVTVGHTPFRSPEFNQYFSVNRATTVFLEPGQQHDHTVYYRYNRLLDSTTFQNSSGVSVAGLTRFCMFVAHGSLGHESAQPSTISYMPVTIDIAWSKEYSYGWLEKTQKSYVVADNNVKVITDWDQMGETGDADVNLVTA